jgi:pyruvate formate-lyase activating enzyme-like uncharacterized protein
MENKLEVGDKLLINVTHVNEKQCCNIELQKGDKTIILAFGIPLENKEDLIKNVKLINVF